jgi:hypothetical protein
MSTIRRSLSLARSEKHLSGRALIQAYVNGP